MMNLLYSIFASPVGALRLIIGCLPIVKLVNSQCLRVSCPPHSPHKRRPFLKIQYSKSPMQYLGSVLVIYVLMMVELPPPSNTMGCCGVPWAGVWGKIVDKGRGVGRVDNLDIMLKQEYC